MKLATNPETKHPVSSAHKNSSFNASNVSVKDNPCEETSVFKPNNAQPTLKLNRYSGIEVRGLLTQVPKTAANLLARNGNARAIANRL